MPLHHRKAALVGLAGVLPPGTLHPTVVRHVSFLILSDSASSFAALMSARSASERAQASEAAAQAAAVEEEICQARARRGTGRARPGFS